MAKEMKKIEIPEGLFEKYGLSNDELKKNPEIWEALISGKKTPLLTLKVNVEGTQLPVAAKLRVYEDKGNIHGYVHTVNANVDLRPYKDHAFSKKEMGMLLSEEGQIKYPINLRFGEKEITCLVGIDKDTKEIIHKPIAMIPVRSEIMGVDMTPHKKILQNGGKVYIENFTRSDGTKFSAVVSFNLHKDGLTFQTPTPTLLQDVRVAIGKAEEKKLENEKNVHKVIDKKDPNLNVSSEQKETRRRGQKM